MRNPHLVKGGDFYWYTVVILERVITISIRAEFYMQKAINKGFTLIELLVVIAIIGILAAIVLVSLGNARSKGADAGIQGNLDTIRTQAEVYASDNSNSYGAQSNVATGASVSCGSTGMWSNPTIAAATKGAASSAGLATLNGSASADRAALCGSTNSAWFIAVPLKADTANAWCVDSAGKAGKALLTSLSAAYAPVACP